MPAMLESQLNIPTLLHLKNVWEMFDWSKPSIHQTKNVDETWHKMGCSILQCWSMMLNYLGLLWCISYVLEICSNNGNIALRIFTGEIIFFKQWKKWWYLRLQQLAFVRYCSKKRYNVPGTVKNTLHTFHTYKS